MGRGRLQMLGMYQSQPPFFARRVAKTIIESGYEEDFFS